MNLSPAEQNSLATAVQEEVPFVAEPWKQIARKVGQNHLDVVAQLRSWIADRKLREISAVLEGSLLGYESALCAATVPAEEVSRVAAVVNEHPTVSHNYLREHAYNLWFTIAVPRAMGLGRTLAHLAARAGLPRIQALQRTRTFKIGVNLDLLTRKNISEGTTATRTAPTTPLTPEDVRLFRSLQVPLPVSERPFLDLARTTGSSEEEILAFGRKHLGRAIRRYVATFRHRHAGVGGNVLVVWNVADDRLEEVGAQLARVPEVSHCYGREPFSGFSYTLYTMIHGPDEASCLRLTNELSLKTGIDDYMPLSSRREFKKCRLRYFLPELDEWWASCAQEGT